MRYVAWGSYSDLIDRVISAKASWQSSNLSLATVQVEDDFGYVDGLKAGQVDITATLDGVSKTVSVSVLPIKALDYETKDAGTNATAVSIDGEGRVHASVAHYFSGPLFSTPSLENLWSFTGTGGWGPKLAANAGFNEGNPFSPVLASNAQGQAVLTWSGNTGLFVTTFTPALGWAPAKAIASGLNGQSNNRSLRASVDASGNAMVVWVEPLTNGVSSSRYDAVTAVWSAPQVVAGGEGLQAASGVSYAANAAGDAVMVRERWNPPGGWEIWANRYTPGTGWGSPQLLRAETVYTNPAVAINSSGAIFVVGANMFDSRVYSARYEPANGWASSEILATTDQAVTARIAVNGAGEAVAAWGSGYDGSIYARRFTTLNGWESATRLSTAGPGTPEVLTPFIALDGRIFVAWNVGQAYVAFRKFYTSSGWSAEGRLNMGFKGAVSDVTLALNSDGFGAAVWAESYSRANSEGFQIPYVDYYADPRIAFTP